MRAVSDTKSKNEKRTQCLLFIITIHGIMPERHSAVWHCCDSKKKPLVFITEQTKRRSTTQMEHMLSLVTYDISGSAILREDIVATKVIRQTR